MSENVYLLTLPEMQIYLLGKVAGSYSARGLDIVLVGRDATANGCQVMTIINGWFPSRAENSSIFS